MTTVQSKNLSRQLYSFGDVRDDTYPRQCFIAIKRPKPTQRCFTCFWDGLDGVSFRVNETHGEVSFKGVLL